MKFSIVLTITLSIFLFNEVTAPGGGAKKPGISGKFGSNGDDGSNPMLNWLRGIKKQPDGSDNPPSLKLPDQAPLIDIPQKLDSLKPGSLTPEEAGINFKNPSDDVRDTGIAGSNVPPKPQPMRQRYEKVPDVVFDSLKKETLNDNLPSKKIKLDEGSDTQTQTVEDFKYDKYLKEELYEGFTIKLRRHHTPAYGNNMGNPFFTLKATSYNKDLEMWKFKTLEIPSVTELGFAAQLTNLNSQKIPLRQSVYENLVKTINPIQRESDKKYYEKDLPGTDEESKYVSEGDTRPLGPTVLKFDSIKNYEMFWVRANSEQKKPERRTMAKWILVYDRSKALTEKKFVERNQRDRLPIKFRVSEQDGVKEYLETHDQAKNLNFDGWKRPGIWEKIPQLNLELKMRSVSSNGEKILYNVRQLSSKNPWSQACSFGVMIKADGYNKVYRLRETMDPKYTIARPQDITDRQYSILKIGPAPTDGWKFIYIMKLDSNSRFSEPDLFKVGVSNNINRRLNDLRRHNLGTIHIVESKTPTPYGYLTEHLAHTILEQKQIKRKNPFKGNDESDGASEWFKGSIEEVRESVEKAVAIVTKLHGDNIYPPPNNQQHDLTV